MTKRIISMMIALCMLLAMSSFAVAEEPFIINACIASEPETIDPGLISSVDGSTYTQHQFENLMKYEMIDELAGEDESVRATVAVFGQAADCIVSDDLLTYTFILQNTGNEAVVATDNAAITDTFDPILTALAVTFDGAPWTQGVEYTYSEVTGLFTTNPGQITVPAATYTQDPVTGAYTVNPGIATLVVTGTI